MQSVRTGKAPRRSSGPYSVRDACHVIPWTCSVVSTVSGGHPLLVRKSSESYPRPECVLCEASGRRRAKRGVMRKSSPTSRQELHVAAVPSTVPFFFTQCHFTLEAEGFHKEP